MLLMFAIPKCLTHIWMYNVSNKTTFIMLFYCLWQHASTLTGSSSGPSKIQILKLTMFKMHCGLPQIQQFLFLFYCLGQHVSTLTRSSSDPPKVQILKLTIFQMRCGLPQIQQFLLLFYCLGQHVSTLTGSSSGPPKIQILKLTIFQMRCGLPQCIWNIVNLRICILDGPEYDIVRVETCCPKQ